MRIGARTGVWRGTGSKPSTLPRRIAWIENDVSKGQFLDLSALGSKLYGTIKLSTESSLYSAPQGGIIFTTGGGKGARRIFISDTKIELQQLTTRVIGYDATTIGSTYEVSFGKDDVVSSIKRDDLVVAEGEFSWRSTTSSSLRLFTSSGGSEATLVDHLRFISFVNDEAEIYPYLDKDGIPCVKDEVSGQFFYNQGAGEFIWGELEEPPKYLCFTPLEDCTIAFRKTNNAASSKMLQYSYDAQEWIDYGVPTTTSPALPLPLGSKLYWRGT